MAVQQHAWGGSLRGIGQTKSAPLAAGMPAGPLGQGAAAALQPSLPAAQQCPLVHVLAVPSALHCLLVQQSEPSLTLFSVVSCTQVLLVPLVHRL